MAETPCHDERYNQKRTWGVSVKVAPVTTNITWKRLKWKGHVKRRDEGKVLKRMLDGPVPGNVERKTEIQLE